MSLVSVTFWCVCAEEDLLEEEQWTQKQQHQQNAVFAHDAKVKNWRESWDFQKHISSNLSVTFG